MLLYLLRFPGMRCGSDNECAHSSQDPRRGLHLRHVPGATELGRRWHRGRRGGRREDPPRHRVVGRRPVPGPGRGAAGPPGLRLSSPMRSLLVSPVPTARRFDTRPRPAHADCAPRVPRTRPAKRRDDDVHARLASRLSRARARHRDPGQHRRRGPGGHASSNTGGDVWRDSGATPTGPRSKSCSSSPSLRVDWSQGPRPAPLG